VEGHELTLRVYEVTGVFAREELYGLCPSCVVARLLQRFAKELSQCASFQLSAKIKKLIAEG
jgi:uncharacterized protein (DUF983 family)